VKLRLVGNVPFFSALSEQDQEHISQRMHLEHRRSGETLFRKGEDSTALYLIKSGWVRLIANGGAALASQGPGSLVGETDLFLGRPRSLGATIASDADLWVLAREDLEILIADNPQLGLRLALAFGSRLALFDEYLVKQRLETLSFLSGLDENVMRAIARRLSPVEAKAGEFIVEAGQPPKALYIVELGQVHLHSSEEGGDFSELGTGETFGEMAVLTGKSNAHSAQAATDVVLWALPVDEFESLTEEYPTVRLTLSQALCEPLLPQDQARAMERLASIPLFSTLSEDALWAVAQRLLLRHVPSGQLIFAEGEPGDALYLIDTGQIEIITNKRRGSDTLARLGTDEFFGEMALLTGKTRSTSARAATHTNLWVLYRSDFDDLVNRYPAISLALSKVLSERLAEMDRRFTENHLRNLKLLAGLSSSQLEDISRRLQPVRYRRGEIILREGDIGDVMFFIESGRVQVVRGEGAHASVLAEMGSGDLFGEMALLSGSPRSATVTALSDLDLWMLSQTDFDELVTAYPNLALVLSRLLSERLRNTDVRLQQPAAAPARVARPRRARSTQPVARPQPQPVAQPRPRPVRRKPRRNLVREIGEAFDGAVTWFGSLSRGAKVRLVLITVLLAWLMFIVAPIMVISTLAADDVTNMQGAIAFVQTAPPPATDTPPPTPQPLVVYQTVILPTATLLPATDTPLPPEATLAPPTQTPWIIVVTATPMPVTDTPIPPTATPVPPTPTPQPERSAASAAQPLPSPTPAENPQPERSLDPRLPSLGVAIQPAGVKPGQEYWRLVEARWQNEAEAGGDHTIYVELLDEYGGRVLNHPVEIRWSTGNLTVITEDKPKPEYASNFPMYNTLGSYAVSVPRLPSDTVVGLGLGTADQPAFTVHTNFFLTFQQVRR
jgi:CRP-like cAMP-binding protein